MYLPRPVRFPLSTGATPVDVALGIAMLGFFGGAPLFVGSLLPAWTTLPVGIVAGVWALCLLFLPFELWKTRASDLELRADGVRILGGRYHGRTIAWSAIAAQPVLADTAPRSGYASGLTLPEGVVILSDNPEEAASLQALAGSLRVLAEQSAAPREAPRPQVARADLVCCEGCGAPAIPCEEASTACAYCGVSVPVPETLRGEVRAAAALVASRTRSTAALRELLRWRSARVVNAILVAALPLLAIAWPACGVFFDEYYQYHDVFRWTHGVLLFVVAATLSTGLVLIAKAIVVLRRAVGFTFATFRACPPQREGDPYECRNCGAPLVRPAESPLAPCVYCRCDNVIGIDLPRYAEPEVEQALKLDELVASQRKARRLWTGLGLFALLSLTCSAALLRTTVVYVAEHPAERHAPRPPR